LLRIGNAVLLAFIAAPMSACELERRFRAVRKYQSSIAGLLQEMGEFSSFNAINRVGSPAK
jgi:hypothetical protein